MKAKRRGLGLQRRIMIYATVGLGLLFVAWGTISRNSIDRVSDLLLQERLATAQSVATTFSDELVHIKNDLGEGMEGIGSAALASETKLITDGALVHLALVDEFNYFEVRGVVLVRSDGSTVAKAPATLTDATVERVAPSGAWPTGSFGTSVSESGDVAIIVTIPVEDRVGDGRATARAIVGTLSSAGPLVGFIPSDEPFEVTAVGPNYHVEIVDDKGMTLLGIGPDQHDSIGQISTHWTGVREIVQAGRQDVIREDNGEDVIAVAAVQVAGTPLHLLLMREDDLAISAPARLRDLFILIGAVGFAGALLVVAVTTKRVVRSTSELTVAAGRMAMGDLDSPVRVWAQDEIGQLAESIETMRVQLAHAREQTLRSNQDLGERVTERTEQLRRALRQVISAQEEERKRVARDLHDGLAQDMIVLTRRLDSALEKLAPGGADRTELKELSDISRASLTSVREISRALRPSVLDDLGLIPALSWVASEFKRRSGVEVEQHLPEASLTAADEPMLVLFRTAQEAFANIDRHSGATRASISLTSTNGSIELQIRDNGRGFDMPSSEQELARRGHLGIIGMLERVELVGGELKIESTPSAPSDQFNTKVTATIPVDLAT